MRKFNSFINNKYRFYFFLNFFEFLKKIFKYFLNQKTNYNDILQKKLYHYFPSSNIHFFNHGRGGFYFLLKKFNNQSRKKVLINSLTS